MQLSRDEFAAHLTALGPFETRPALAVAVSGGADSLALTLLTAQWAAARGGSVTALTVDHGLRPDSAGEARRVGEWLAARGIPHAILGADERLPATGVAAAARRLRYRLLCAWCRSAGVLHLLLGHHRADQSETVLMRWLRGSGAAGLAGMAAVVELPAVRLLRPLLSVEPGRLRACLRQSGQPWIEDPSNESARFTRNRLRRLLPDLGAGGITVDGLARLARHGAEVRNESEAAAAALLAGGCGVHPAGFAVLDRRALASVPRWQAGAALARLVTTIGGREWPPTGGKVERILTGLLEDAARGSATLAGCGLVREGERILVFREPRGLPAPRPIADGDRVHWDNRFVLRVDIPGRDEGNHVLQSIRDMLLSHNSEDYAIVREGVLLPAPVKASLPVVCVDGAIAALPSFGSDPEGGTPRPAVTIEARFRPRRSLSGHGDFLA